MFATDHWRTQAASLDQLSLECVDSLLAEQEEKGIDCVPRWFAEKVPDALLELEGEARKRYFIAFMLPLSVKANNELVRMEQKLICHSEQNPEGENPEPQFSDEELKELYALYGASGEGALEELRKRLRPVPHALVIAQSALESGWGTSRFAHQGNALFGQRSYDRDTPKIIPQDRAEGANYGVQSFASPLDSVRAYLVNLNSTAAYESIRVMRDESYQNNEKPSALQLATGLGRYAETGERYIRQIQDTINANILHRLDRADFHGGDFVSKRRFACSKMAANMLAVRRPVLVL